MLVVLSNLLIPSTMVIFGAIWTFSEVGYINSIIGYRTLMSMKNQETWEYAHRYYGKIIFRSGLILLIITTFFIMDFKEHTDFSAISLFVLLFQLVIILLPIIPTEKKLKDNFDEKGRRKKSK